MKNILLAAALLSMAACSSTNKSAVGSPESANAPAAACSSACSTGSECGTECTDTKTECSAAKTECSGMKPAAQVCPVTGQTSN